MKTYPYNKLNKAAKAAALEEWRTQDNWYWFDDEYVKEDFTERGKERGFEIDRIYWSGFWNQGDGASWEGRIDMQQWVAYKIAQEPKPSAVLMALEALVKNACSVPVNVGRQNYCHENTMALDEDYIFDWGDEYVIEGGVFDGANCEGLYNSLGINFPRMLLEDARQWARDIYKALEEEYEYQTSAEHFADMCEGNDWRFDSCGHFVRRSSRRRSGTNAAQAA